MYTDTGKRPSGPFVVNKLDFQITICTKVELLQFFQFAQDNKSFYLRTRNGYNKYDLLQKTRYLSRIPINKAAFITWID